MSGSVLAVDIGRTNCRATLVDDGTRVATVTVDSGVTLVDSDSATRLTGLVERSAFMLCGESAPALSSIVISAAGARSRPDTVHALAQALAAGRVGHAELVVTTDVVAAHAGALRGAPGAVVAVGTGSVAFVLNAAGESAQVDGAGYLVGDAGSGFAVGRAGLGAALRHYDGRAGGSEQLAAAAARRFGPLADLAGRLHGDPEPARSVASFAPEVAATARAGDPVARRIWDEAVADLTDTVVAACEWLPAGPSRYVLTGGLFDVEDLLTKPLTTRIADRCPEAVRHAAQGDTLDGAAQFAHGPAGVYESLLLRYPRSF